MTSSNDNVDFNGKALEVEETRISSENLEPSDSGNEPGDLEKGGGAGLTAVLEKRTKKFVILVAAVAALGGLIFGYDIAGAGATFVMTGFRYHFKWDCREGAIGCVDVSQGRIDLDKGLINGLFGAGAAIGALINSYISEKFGRRKCLGISSCVFILGASMQTWAPAMGVMQAGRIFSGMGIGMLSMCSPVYVGECAPEHVRGALGTLWQLAITVGIVLASALNLWLQTWDNGWRISYGGNILFAVMLLVCLMFMPESPRWLAAHATDKEVEEALRRIRFEDEIESEKAKLKHEVEEERALGNAPWNEVFSTKNLMSRRVTIGFVMFAFQQLSGINATMFYAPDILNTFFTESQAIAGTLVLNSINCVSTFITTATVDRFGRTKLLTLGGMIMCPCLIALGIFSSVEQSEAVGYAVLAFSGIYIIGFAFSWGPVLWIVIPEMFPYRTRGKAVSICVFSNWMFTTLVGALFPVASSASLAGCFWFFAGAIFIGVCVVYFFQVETAQKTSDEIDEAYAKHVPALKRKDW